MSIRLETSKRNGVTNFQDSELSRFQHHGCKMLLQQHPQARQRTQACPVYNCHGLTFACRRTKVLYRKDIDLILNDDGYREVSLEDVLPGDVVIYFSAEGDPNHSGIVVEMEDTLHVPRICSKWGYAGEFVHVLHDVPNLYGPRHKFFRCEL